MKIGPKYKIARRLGTGIFEKTQTQKYALREARRKIKRSGPKSDYGLQLLEKQKARFSYGVNERQFSKYVKEAVAKKNMNSVDLLYKKLESRLDNVVYRIGFAPTRLAARQMVSHGHILVNAKKVTIPSYTVLLNDKVSIREGSKKSALFTSLSERIKERTMPTWINLNHDSKEAEIQGSPKLGPQDASFDLSAVVEFYSRS